MNEQIGPGIPCINCGMSYGFHAETCQAMPEKPVGGFLENQFERLVVAFAEPRITVSNNRLLVDAFLDSIDRDKLALNLARAEAAALHNRTSPNHHGEMK